MTPRKNQKIKASLISNGPRRLWILRLSPSSRCRPIPRRPSARKLNRATGRCPIRCRLPTRRLARSARRCTIRCRRSPARPTPSMPELPEVETVRAGLEQHVLGRTIATAAVLNPRAVRRDPTGPAGFTAAMIGRTLTRAERRGKYLWFVLDDGSALLAHLGMSGQLLVGEPDRELSSHVRARFTFTDGGPDLRFTDQRTFGHLMVAPLVPAIKASPDDPEPDDPSLVPEPISHIAPDPLEAAFAPGAFAARLSRRKTGIKRALLDPSLISG